jgi:3-hydroxyacyl-CoA dehydrogenase/enoyl-CoA hydratase/3-hydroxybutyryl-CoA epimerase
VFDTSAELKVPFDDLIDRYLLVQAIETPRVFDDGVMDSDADANIGSIFGIGYPAWTGGVRRFVNGYPAAGPRPWSAATTSPRVTGNGSSHRRPCASRAYGPEVR